MRFGSTLKVAGFMNKVGTIKPEAGSWKDLFFPELYRLPGS
jgi:hypothetical protein